MEKNRERVFLTEPGPENVDRSQFAKIREQFSSSDLPPQKSSDIYHQDANN